MGLKNVKDAVTKEDLLNLSEDQLKELEKLSQAEIDFMIKTGNFNFLLKRLEQLEFAKMEEEERERVRLELEKEKEEKERIKKQKIAEGKQVQKPAMRKKKAKKDPKDRKIQKRREERARAIKKSRHRQGKGFNKLFKIKVRYNIGDINKPIHSTRIVQIWIPSSLRFKSEQKAQWVETSIKALLYKHFKEEATLLKITQFYPIRPTKSHYNSIVL